MTQTRKRKQVPIAVAVFNTLAVKGEVIAKPSARGVTIFASFVQLPPGQHGFHIHKAGDLRGEGCQGACAHFHKGSSANHGGAPGETKHRHTGDLGNISLEDGKVKKTYHLKGVSVQDLWGRSAIVHADEDDLGLGPHDDSKTTGHSGGRIACAIFGRGLDC